MAALGRKTPGISMERNFSMKQLDTRGSQNNALQVVVTETKRNPPALQDETRELRGKISKFYDLAPKKILRLLQMEESPKRDPQPAQKGGGQNQRQHHRRP